MLSTIKGILLGKATKVSSQFEFISGQIASTKEEITDLHTAINCTTDPILLNQLIYKLKSMEMMYQYWFKMARDMGITSKQA